MNFLYIAANSQAFMTSGMPISYVLRIVFGDRDPLYPVRLALELREAIPRSSLWVVPNRGHAPIFGPYAAGFVETANAFLRGDWPKK